MSEIKEDTGYAEARKAIAEGKAKGHAMWIILSDEHDRDGYALKPIPWEGPGEYQHVTYDDGRNGLVRITGQSLPTDWGKRFAPDHPYEPGAYKVCRRCGGEKH